MTQNVSELPLTWIITEGMAGTENQCLGVADALALNPEVKRVSLRQPWRAFSPWLGLETALTFQPPLKAPWPDLLLTSGRKAVAAARYIKKQSRNKTFTVHIQDPRVSPHNFDLLSVPHHDPARGANVIVTDTAPNLINDATLSHAGDAFRFLESLPQPRIAVLIGGTSQAYKMSGEVMHALIRTLQELQSQYCAGLMITASRRTGEENLALLREKFAESDSAFLWDGKGANPYRGYLSCADFILVTADSVSMISDALATGKPTYIIPMEGGAKRIDAFHHHIIEKGYARFLERDLESWSYAPQRAAEVIAQEIRNRSGLFDE